MADKKRMAEHSARTGEALNSLYGSSTPITSILPVQEKVDVSTTSSDFRTKGTRSPSRTTMPEKLLIQISDPGTRPTEPTTVANPGTLARPNFANAGFREPPLSYDVRSGRWDTRHPNYARDVGIMNLAINRYNTYVSNLSRYNTDLTDYNTRVAQRDTEVAKNTRITNQYERDLKKFFTTLGKKKVSKKIATRSRGARNPGTTSTRGSRV
tara:strand:- start:1355 stop:1987 length:633 start_codon:yes stop_codon:yes gene_type:complete